MEERSTGGKRRCERGSNCGTRLAMHDFFLRTCCRGVGFDSSTDEIEISPRWKYLVNADEDT
jgi:hypothetical protein